MPTADNTTANHHTGPDAATATAPGAHHTAADAATATSAGADHDPSAAAPINNAGGPRRHHRLTRPIHRRRHRPSPTW